MKMTGEVRIEAPPEAVWARLLDLASAPDYVPYLTAAEPASAEPVKVGSTADLTFQGGGLQATGTAAVTGLEPPRRLALEVAVPQFHLAMDVTVTVSAAGATSQVSELVEVRFSTPFMKAMGEGLLRLRDPEAHLRQGLLQLKRSVEGQA